MNPNDASIRRKPYASPATVWTRIETESGVCAASASKGEDPFSSGNVHVDIHQTDAVDFSVETTWDEK